jgi:hypothetical protein
MSRAFEDYYANRPALVGLQPSSGDELLVLRGGTVYRGQYVLNRAFAYLDNNAVATAISVTDTWYQLAPAFTQGFTTATFTYATNQFTYIGPDKAEADQLYASISFSNAGGAAAVYEVGLFVNGVLKGIGVGAGLPDTAVATDQMFVAATVLHQFQTGDIVDLRVRNRTNVEDILVVDAQLLIS